MKIYIKKFDFGFIRTHFACFKSSILNSIFVLYSENVNKVNFGDIYSKTQLSKNREQCNFGFGQLTNQLNPLEVLKELSIILNHPLLITIVNSLLHTAVLNFERTSF